MALSEDDITRAVARAREAVGSSSTWSEAPALPRHAGVVSRATSDQPGVFPTLEQAVRAAEISFGQFREYPREHS